MEKSKHMSDHAVNEVLAHHNVFVKHASDMYIYLHTNTKNTQLNAIQTHDAQTSRMHIF
jgi:hypothetical protein